MLLKSKYVVALADTAAASLRQSQMWRNLYHFTYWYILVTCILKLQLISYDFINSDYYDYISDLIQIKTNFESLYQRSHAYWHSSYESDSSHDECQARKHIILGFLILINPTPNSVALFYLCL